MTLPLRTDAAANCDIEDLLDEWSLTYQLTDFPFPVTSHQASDVYDEVARGISPYRMSANTSELLIGRTRFLTTGISTQPPILADALRIDVSDAVFPISFATVHTRVDIDAAKFLARLPWIPLRSILAAVSQWVAAAPVTAARVRLISQSIDDETWDEAVVQLRLHSDTETALTLWDQFSRHLDAVRLTLTPDDRHVIDRNISFHLNWGDDPEL